MPTDDERREAARKLRELRGLDYCKDPRYAVQLSSDAIAADHGNGYSWDKMLDRLADLIDPVDVSGEVCEIEGIGVGEPLPPVVDRDALLALADELENRAKFSEQAPCVWLVVAASKIREAVGA